MRTDLGPCFDIIMSLFCLLHMPLRAPFDGRFPWNCPIIKSFHMFWFLLITSFGILTHISPDSRVNGVPFLAILPEEPMRRSFQEGKLAFCLSSTPVGNGYEIRVSDPKGREDRICLGGVDLATMGTLEGKVPES